MRGKHDGIAGLDGDLRFIESGGGRVGGRDESGDYANRNSQYAQSLLIIAAQLADRFHVLDVFVNTAARKHILDDLIFYFTKSCVLHSHFGEALRIADACVRDAAYNVIYLSLIHPRKFLLRFFCRLNQISHFLHGDQIFIN